MSVAAKRKPAAAGMDLVYGLGATGLSVARFLARNERKARFFDSRKEPPGMSELKNIFADAETITGEAPKSLLKKTSRIIVSPGIADTDNFLRSARDAGVEIVSDIELFVRESKAPIVAITGSNGKSTVTTLVSLMCQAAGRNGLAGGNLGVPALDLLAEDEPDFYLLELSSFQLQRTSDLPAKVAVLLNISPDHLDWHASEDEYRQAKYRIFKQAEAAVINRADAEVGAHLPAGIHTISFGLDAPDADQYGLLVEGDECFLARGDQLLLSATDVAMVGAHNRANALAALAAGELLDLDLSSMLQVLNEFPGLPHRMQAAGRIGDVLYINDSKATNVGAAIAAVESVDGPVILIAGGQGKGGDFDKLATATRGHLRAAVLLGEDATLLEEAFDELTPTERVLDMRAAVEHAANLALSGDTVLLAPACASFDQFENFQARGDAFCRAVEALPR